jgi:hypothetical protein
MSRNLNSNAMHLRKEISWAGNSRTIGEACMMLQVFRWTYVVELNLCKVIHDPELDEYRQPSPMRFTMPKTGEYRGLERKRRFSTIVTMFIIIGVPRRTP